MVEGTQHSSYVQALLYLRLSTQHTTPPPPRPTNPKPPPLVGSLNFAFRYDGGTTVHCGAVLYKRNLASIFLPSSML